MFAKFDEIPSMILEVIKETKRYGHTVGRSDGWTVGQRENSIPSHKHSLRGGITTCNLDNNCCCFFFVLTRSCSVNVVYSLLVAFGRTLL